MAEEETKEENEADVAAQWAAVADDGEAQAASGSILDQNEIDSLLGFGGEEGETKGASGIRAIIDSALVSYERLPMLEVVFDRLVRMMSTSLRNFTSDNVEVSIDNITSIRFGDYLNSIPLPAMLSVFKAEEWDNYGLLTIDSALIYSIVDVLLGGRRGTAAMRIEGRPYTTIERNLVERLVAVVLSDLSGAFDPLSPVTFRFDRLETNPRTVSHWRDTRHRIRQAGSGMSSERSEILQPVQGPRLRLAAESQWLVRSFGEGKDGWRRSRTGRRQGRHDGARDRRAG